MAVTLPHTLQTDWGMVRDNGKPIHREVFPGMIVQLSTTRGKEEGRERLRKIVGSDEELETAFATMVADLKTGTFKIPETVPRIARDVIKSFDAYDMCPVDPLRDLGLQRFAANLTACAADVSVEDLKKWIQTRTRFDLEQAAAIVISAIRKHGRVEDAIRLLEETHMLLATSCMWMDSHIRPAEGKRLAPWIHNLADKLWEAATHMDQDIPFETEYQKLVPLLMRVRRSRPDDRCLHIPQWMFEEAKIEAPEHFKEFFLDDRLQPRAPYPGRHPKASRGADSIILSKKHFRHIQGRIFRLHKFWRPNIRHRESIRKLEAEVLYANSWIHDRVFKTDDVALICHYFFYFQRRLQRKVVSDMTHTSFLAKGEGARVFQNNISVKSTFEKVLLEIADSGDSGVLVAMGNADTLDLIDETCLLMKKYVDIYGAGKTENLVYRREVRGGSGRGPVDDYNLLCTILAQLRAQAKDEGIADVPGPTYKFLAKDIMHWNNAWQDDAFAQGRVPGWKDWIQKRGLIDDDWEVMDAEPTALPVRESKSTD